VSDMGKFPARSPQSTHFTHCTLANTRICEFHTCFLPCAHRYVLGAFIFSARTRAPREQLVLASGNRAGN